MSGNGRLPTEGGINEYINEYPFLQHPTTANENKWAAGAAAAAISGHQAAALIHHTRNHAQGITQSLKEQGVTPTKSQNQVQVHLAFLRDAYKNAQWHHPSYPPTQSPPPVDVLTPLVTMTNLCRQHAPGQSPYHLLWGPQGFVLQAIRARPHGRLTRATASDGLRRLRQAFQLPEPPSRRRKTPAAAVAAAIASTTTPDPEVPRGASMAVPALGEVSPPLPLSPRPAAEKKEKPAAAARRQTPSPPPMPEDGNESDDSATGIVMQLFSRPNLPLAPSSRKFKAIRAEGLAAHANEEKKRKAAKTRQLNKEKKEAAMLAKKKGEEEEEEEEEEGEEEEDEEKGLDLKTKKEIADDIATAAARAASRVAKRKWGHLLQPARRGVVTRRVKAKANEAVMKTI